MRKVLLTILFVTGCSDASEVIATWGDAQEVWASAWCDYRVRCAPDEFMEEFGTDAQCNIDVYQLNCGDTGYCDADYPHDPRLVEICADEMAKIACNANRSPPACWAAYD